MAQSNRQTKMLSLLIRAFAVFVILMPGVPAIAFGEEPIDPQCLLGPKPGYLFYYEGHSGLKMRVQGIAWDKNGALILKRTMVFPIASDSASQSISELTEVYALTARDGRLLSKGVPESAPSVLVVELDLKKSTWGNPVTSPTGEVTASQCQLAAIHNEFLFGKERRIVETSGKLCIPSAYAAGIGLVRYNDLKLVRIEKSGRPVLVY